MSNRSGRPAAFTIADRTIRVGRGRSARLAVTLRPASAPYSCRANFTAGETETVMRQRLCTVGEHGRSLLREALDEVD